MTFGIIALCMVQVAVYARMALPQENITKSIRKVDRSFLKNKNFWLGAAILFFYISTEYAIVNWLVTYFKDTGTEKAGIQVGMGVVVAVTVLLLITIFFSVFSKGGNEE